MDYKREYIELLLMTQDEVYEYVVAKAKEYNYDVEKMKDSYIYCYKKETTPDNRPLLLSHMDTVDTGSTIRVTSSDIELDFNTGYLALNKHNNCVLGADDRSGVWIMLQLMRFSVDTYNFLFTCDEEIGGIGARDFVNNTNIDYHNHSCFISLDRRGKNDVATYGCDNEALIKVFTDIGYEEKMGSFTDCLTLSDSCDVACVNLSVGYEYEHTSNEIQHLQTMYDLVELLSNGDLHSQLVTTPYRYDTYQDKSYSDYDDGTCVVCDCCGDHAKLYYTRVASGHNMMLCDACITDWYY